jgi:cytochrome b
MAEADAPTATARIAVWDLPTRVFHWSLVGLISLAWWSGEEERFDLHFWAGYAILFLVIFRLLWGMIGSSTARFANFVRGPAAILSYLRDSGGSKVGHSPIGALSVLGLLGVVALMVATGLVQAEREHGEWIVGPLAHLVSEDISEAAHDLHELLFNVLLGLIGLHVAAILFYRLVLGKALLGPMLTGRGSFPEGTEPMRRAPLWRLIICILLSLAVTSWIIGGAPALWG